MSRGALRGARIARRVAVGEPARVSGLSARAAGRAAGARANRGPGMSASDHQSRAWSRLLGGVLLAPGDRRADPASEGAPAGPARPLDRSALSRASPAVGQERRGSRATHVHLRAGTGGRGCSYRAGAAAAADRRARPGLGAWPRRARAGRPAGARALRGDARGVGHRRRVRPDGRRARPDVLRVRRGAAAARAGAARAAAAQHRSALDEPGGHAARSVVQTGSLGGGARVLPGGRSPRPAASRWTIPTPIWS